ncbi:MAG: hypothetical protein DRO10_01700 [Thermoprotei archaeon]|nr:MAG: hypothetical protein DRO10_01700 [Thermoprotei archaeon]
MDPEVLTLISKAIENRESTIIIRIIMETYYGTLAMVEIHKKSLSEDMNITLEIVEVRDFEELSRLSSYLTLKLGGKVSFKGGGILINVSIHEGLLVLKDFFAKFIQLREDIMIALAIVTDWKHTLIYIKPVMEEPIKALIEGVIQEFRVKKTFFKQYLEIRVKGGKKVLIPVESTNIQNLIPKLKLLTTPSI